MGVPHLTDPAHPAVKPRWQGLCQLPHYRLVYDHLDRVHRYLYCRLGAVNGVLTCTWTPAASLPSSAWSHCSPRAIADTSTSRRSYRGKPLTAFSQTDRTAPDQSGRSGHPMDPELRLRILAHSPDAWH